MKILVAAGASGGHIYPALSFIDELKGRDSRIGTLLVLPKRANRAFIPGNGYNVKYIGTPKVALKFSVFFQLLTGSAQSLELLLKYKPDLVVGFGSSDSLPLVFLAWLLRIRTMIHEQNVIPGKANRILAKLVDKVAVSFPETSGFFKADQRRLTVTGNPLRRSICLIERKEALKFFGLQEKFTIAVIGGSQGSHRINMGMLKALDKSLGCQVIHIAGETDADLVKTGYQNLGIDAKVYPFLREINYAYSAADLVVSRSGASSIYELIFFKKPAVLIPYPFAYEHQLKNAEVLAQADAACIVRDQDLDYNILKEALSSLCANPQRLAKMRAGYQKIEFKPAARLLAEMALQP